MKKFLMLAFVTLFTFTTSFAKGKHTAPAAAPTTVAAQVKDIASSTVHSVGNAIDSGKVAVKNGVNFVDTSSNFKMFYNDVKSGIAGLATALKTGAEQVFYILCKQQIVKAVGDLLVVLVFFGLALFLYKGSRKAYDTHLKLCGYQASNAKDSMYRIDLDDSAKGIVSIIMGILSVVALVAGVMAFCNTYNEMLTGFINPAYGAMHDIIDFIKQVRK